MKVSRKAREWVLRYVPAEIMGTIAAVGVAVAVQHSFGRPVLSAVLGTIAETLAFYGFFIVRDLRQHAWRNQHRPPLRRAGLSVGRTMHGIVMEFGPAECVDSLFVRPFCMIMGPVLLGNFAVGVFAGKLAADAVFYTCAICCYELRKRWVGTPALQLSD